MGRYSAVYEDKFVENLRHYAKIRQRIKRRVEQILMDPYVGSELLSDPSGRMNLRGCRSARIDRNFCVIFVVCEECRRVPECEFCFCEGLSDKAIVFLTVGPHDQAYAMR